MGYSHKQYKRDANHGEVVATLKRAGVYVIDLAAVGGGIPDLLVAYQGHLSFLEIKNPERRQGNNRVVKGVPVYVADDLSDSQALWLAEYGDKGPPIRIVYSGAEALAAIGAVEASYPPPVEPEAPTPAAAAKGG